MPTPNATLAMQLIREFTDSDPVLSDLLSRTTHRHWPIGHTACRKKTSGSGNWSDHAWGNALDIMRLSKWKDPNDPAKGIAHPGEPHYLDLIWRFLVPNTEPWDLRPSQMLWRTTRHWDHIHISWRHRGTGTPPCDGGRLETIRPSGGWQLTMDAGGTQPPAGGDDEVQVEDLQKVLTDAGYEPGAIDGIYGPKTEAAWTAMMADAHSIQTMTLKSTTTEVVSAVTLG